MNSQPGWPRYGRSETLGITDGDVPRTFTAHEAGVLMPILQMRLPGFKGGIPTRLSHIGSALPFHRSLPASGTR